MHLCNFVFSPKRFAWRWKLFMLAKRWNYKRIRADPSFPCLDLCFFSFFPLFSIIFFSIFHSPETWLTLGNLKTTIKVYKDRLWKELFHQLPKWDAPVIPRKRHENQLIPAIPTWALHQIEKKKIATRDNTKVLYPPLLQSCLSSGSYLILRCSLICIVWIKPVTSIGSASLFFPLTLKSFPKTHTIIKVYKDIWAACAGPSHCI